MMPCSVRNSLSWVAASFGATGAVPGGAGGVASSGMSEGGRGYGGGGGGVHGDLAAVAGHDGVRVLPHHPGEELGLRLGRPVGGLAGVTPGRAVVVQVLGRAGERD